MTRLRMRVADRLKGAQNTYAMLSTFNEVDMTGLMQLRSDFKVNHCRLLQLSLSGSVPPLLACLCFCTKCSDNLLHQFCSLPASSQDLCSAYACAEVNRNFDLINPVNRWKAGLDEMGRAGRLQCFIGSGRTTLSLRLGGDARGRTLFWRSTG